MKQEQIHLQKQPLHLPSRVKKVWTLLPDASVYWFLPWYQTASVEYQFTPLLVVPLNTYLPFHHNRFCISLVASTSILDVPLGFTGMV
jgi:hypothetical protein